MPQVQKLDDELGRRQVGPSLQHNSSARVAAGRQQQTAGSQGSTQSLPAAAPMQYASLGDRNGRGNRSVQRSPTSPHIADMMISRQPLQQQQKSPTGRTQRPVRPARPARPALPSSELLVLGPEVEVARFATRAVLSSGQTRTHGPVRAKTPERAASRTPKQDNEPSASFKTHQIRIRDNLPSPETSPGKIVLNEVVHIRVPTPDSAYDRTRRTEVEAIKIGMALGSPSQANNATFSWRPQVPQTHNTTPKPSTDSQPHPTKEKSRRWGLFSRSKSKKIKETEEVAESRNRAATHPGFHRPSNAGFPLTTAGLSHDGRGSSGGQQTRGSGPQPKPGVVRSNTAPVLSYKHSDRPLLRQKHTSPPTMLEAPFLVAQQSKLEEDLAAAHQAAAAMTTDKLLDIEIPSIALDRYSVMFKTLLPTKPRPESGLLARRQAKLSKLQTIQDDELPAPAPETSPSALMLLPKRTSSPLPRGSPTFSLFPSTPTKPNTPPMLTSRSRSNTFPVMIPSPLQTTTYSELPQGRNAGVGKPSGSPPSNAPPRSHPLQRSTTPDELSPHSGDHHLSIGTGASRTWANLPSTPAIAEEPEEAESRHSTSMSFSEGGNRGLAVSNAARPHRSPLSMLLTATGRDHGKSPQRVPPPSQDDPAKSFDQAVEKSIARQISLSQHQRRLLNPLAGASAGSGAGTRKLSASAAAAAAGGVGAGAGETARASGHHSRVAETKTAVPMLVHPHLGVPGVSAMHRRSERVILEGA